MNELQMQEAHDARELYRRVWDRTYAAFWFRERLTDWERWFGRFDDRIFCVDDAVAACNEMLSSLGDRFTKLRPKAVAMKIERERTSPQPLSSANLIADGVALIRITSFDKKGMAEELHHNLHWVRGARAFIIDLRGNGGGLIDEARLCASLFMDHGILYRTRDLDAGYERENVYRLQGDCVEQTVVSKYENKTRTASRLPNMAAGRPVVILVDEATASASEQFASALWENNRALIIGSPPVGKGIFQNEYGMWFGTTLVVTCGIILSPSGHWCGDAGQTVSHSIQPDIRVAAVPGTDAWLDAALDHLARRVPLRHLARCA